MVFESLNKSMPFSIIMFRDSEVRHKRMYGCSKKRLNTGTSFYNPYIS